MSSEWHKRVSLNDLALKPSDMRHIVCHHQDGYHLIWLREVLLFSKEGRFTTVRTTDDRTWFTDLSITQLVQRIDHPAFFRISRGVMIRKDAIRSFQIQEHGNGLLETRDKETFTITRPRLQACIR